MFFFCCYYDVYFIYFSSLYKENVSLEFILHYPFLLTDFLALRCVYGVIPCI